MWTKRNFFPSFFAKAEPTLINWGASYIVNDLYKRFFNPTASDTTLVRISYLASILVVGVGVFFGFRSAV